MPISQTDSLFQLIKSLTKAEKRSFRLYALRNHSNDSLMFIDLFDLIDRTSEADHADVFDNLKGINKTQYANLKRHLYSQIMVSLRLIHKTKRANIQVREYLDFAYILYGKGLYLQALKLLGIARREAKKHHLNFLHLTIVEFEKLIETRHITRSGEQKAAELIVDATDINNTITSAIYLSNLRVELHGKYLKHGHTKTKADQVAFKENFTKKLKDVKEDQLGLIEQIYLYQSYVWYHYIQMDFDACLKYAIKWVDLFSDNPELITRDVDLYMRGFHYIISATFHLRDIQSLEKYLALLTEFRKSSYKKFNFNSQIISFLYVHTGRLNRIIITGNFEEGLAIIPKTLKRINRYRKRLDDHRILVFYFKIAWIYLGAGNINRAIFYLNKIVNKDIKNLREDLQIHARILFLICHYESDDAESMLYALKSFQPFFKRIKDFRATQSLAVDLFKQLAKTPKFEHKDLMSSTLQAYEQLNNDPFSQIANNYLDLAVWLKAKISRKDLGDVVREEIG